MRKLKIKQGIIKNAVLVQKASFFNAKFQTTLSCSLKDKYVQTELENAEEKVNYKNKSKKSKIWNTILLVVNFLVIVGIFTYFSLTNGNIYLGELFKLDIAWIYLLCAVLMFLLNSLIETLKYYQLIKKSTGKRRFFLSMKTHFLGRYYDNITPFGAGGQPFQVFYLNKHDIKGDKATSIPVVKHVFQLVAFLIVSIAVLVANIFIPYTRNVIIIVVAAISALANGAIVGTIFLLSVSKKIGPAFIIKLLKFLNKIRIVKNYKVTFFKVCKFVKNYQKSMKSFAKSKLTIFIQIILSILTYVSFYAIVYFIYLAFLPVSQAAQVSYLTIFSCMILCDLTASIMPLPGGSGLAEISFDALFKNWFASNVFTWAMLIWRSLTYFIYIFIGGVQIFSSYIKSLIIKRKQNINKK
ncbi:MAG: flippase-like domain-containing protein [Clostridiales bacterium]|nr:flippase-like domain-containing protein [Clostridiales bacterium]